MNSEHGIILSEMLVVMLITSLLMAALLNTHAQLQAQLLHSRERQQAHERARMASLMIEREARRAGFWGLLESGAIQSMPSAVSGARGEIRCTRQPCATADHDLLAGSGFGSDAVIVRYARPANELADSELPYMATADALKKWRYYATGFYLSGTPRGLFQRIAGQRNAQELVRGICELTCRYATIDEQGKMSPWQAGAAIRQWQAVVALRCTITATGNTCSDTSAIVQRQVGIVLRNPLTQWQARRQWQRITLSARRGADNRDQ